MKKNYTPTLEKQFDRIIEANNNPKPKPEKRTYRKSIGMTKKDKLLINKMKTKPKLDNALRQRVFDNSFGMCYHCKGRATEAHHVISKTLLNIKLYGIERIDSIENLIPVCHGCHDKHSLWDGELRRELREKWSTTIESKIINKLVTN